MDYSGDVVNVYIHVSIMSNSQFITPLFVAMDEWKLQKLHLFPCIVCLLERNGRSFSWLLAEGICLCSLSKWAYQIRNRIYIHLYTDYYISILNKSGKTTLLLTFNFNTQFLLCFCLIPLHQISVLFAATADVHIPATIVVLLQSAFFLAASKLFHIFCHFIFLGVTILDQVGTLYHSKLDIPSSCSLYILQPMCFHY